MKFSFYTQTVFISCVLVIFNVALCEKIEDYQYEYDDGKELQENMYDDYNNYNERTYLDEISNQISDISISQQTEEIPQIPKVTVSICTIVCYYKKDGNFVGVCKDDFPKINRLCLYCRYSKQELCKKYGIVVS